MSVLSAEEYFFPFTTAGNTGNLQYNSCQLENRSLLTHMLVSDKLFKNSQIKEKKEKTESEACVREAAGN